MSNTGLLSIIEEYFLHDLVPIGYRRLDNAEDDLGLQIVLACPDCNMILQNSMFTELNEVFHLIDVGNKNQKHHKTTTDKDLSCTGIGDSDE